MKEWNPQWEKQWSKTSQEWDNIKKVYNDFYQCQESYWIENYEIELDAKKKHQYDKKYPYIRAHMKDLYLGRAFLIASRDRDLPLQLKYVQDFFYNNCIITDEKDLDEAYEIIAEKTGLTYLSKKKQQEKEKQKAIEEKKAQRISGTIYGIFVANRLVYIGKTIREPEERWKEHLKYAENPELESSQQEYLYRAMRLYKGQVEFKILKRNTFLNNYELEKLEKLLIENLKPDYNYEGVAVPYKFSKDKVRKNDGGMEVSGASKPMSAHENNDCIKK